MNDKRLRKQLETKFKKYLVDLNDIYFNSKDVQADLKDLIAEMEETKIEIDQLGFRERKEEYETTIRDFVVNKIRDI